MLVVEYQDLGFRGRVGEEIYGVKRMHRDILGRFPQLKCGGAREKIQPARLEVPHTSGETL